MKKMLTKLQKNDPQYEINGYRNVWIAKPNCKFLFMQLCQEEEELDAITIYMISSLIVLEELDNLLFKNTYKIHFL